MIFTACTKCNEPLVVGYEAGDPGAGMYSREVCEKCGAANYVQLVSFAGVTLSEAEAQQRGLRKPATEPGGQS